MEVMRVKRHGSTRLIVFLVLLIMFFLLVPTKFAPTGEKNITVEEEYTTFENVTIITPQETTKLVKDLITLDIEVRQDKIRRRTRSGNNYAEQEVVFIASNPIDLCFNYNYTFLRNGDRVNKEKKEACLNNQQNLTILKELYTGDISQYNFKISIPEVKYLGTVEKKIMENLSVTNQEEVVKLRNVTKLVDSDEVQRVNWITGYRWWFLD